MDNLWVSAKGLGSFNWARDGDIDNGNDCCPNNLLSKKEVRGLDSVEYNIGIWRSSRFARICVKRSETLKVFLVVGFYLPTIQLLKIILEQGRFWNNHEIIALYIL